MKIVTPARKTTLIPLIASGTVFSRNTGEKRYYMKLGSHTKFYYDFQIHTAAVSLEDGEIVMCDNSLPIEVEEAEVHIS